MALKISSLVFVISCVIEMQLLAQHSISDAYILAFSMEPGACFLTWLHISHKYHHFIGLYFHLLGVYLHVSHKAYF